MLGQVMMVGVMDEGGWTRRRLPYSVCKGHRGQGEKKEAGVKSRCVGDGGQSEGRVRRHGLARPKSC
jgi:hypothetical protein